MIEDQKLPWKTEKKKGISNQTYLKEKKDMSEFSSKAYLDMQLLRFTTAGSVDDGKSTLIGRLLFDSKSIFQDQLDALELASVMRGNENIDLSLLTDGLRAEREQGITIDVAYRYFATPKRKFIIADTPGHIQYTRNMVTGASTANAAIILIDARNGVIEQTYRHSYIASLLQIPHLIVCINKMDLVNYNQATYEKIKADYLEFCKKLEIRDLYFVPMSALNGDNVVDRSTNMDWFEDKTLLELLETMSIEKDENLIDPRFPVQYVVRPQSDKFHDYRGYAGRVASGFFKQGQEVMVLPAMLKSKIEKIHSFETEFSEAMPPMSVNMTLADDIDISRGDMIVAVDNLPVIQQDIELMICWLNEKPLQLNGKYSVKHTSRDVKCIIKSIDFKIDVNTQQQDYEDKNIRMNDIAKIQIKTTKPLFFDSYKKNRQTGSLILIDEATNVTVGAGMILG